jgi:RNA polymerase sigma-70 factor (ECF subfamily)
VLSQTDTFEESLVAARPSLKAWAIKLCGNVTLADDLVQNTMVRALANREKFIPGTNFDAWLFTILRNDFYSRRRSRSREVEDPDESMALAMSFDDDPRRKLEVVELLKLVEKLPDQFRRPLLMIADGASYEEVALELREHVGTIKSRVNRGRAMIGVSTNNQ